jgi:trigger factor
METTVEPLEGNRVKLHVAVPAAEFEKAVDAAFRKLAREVKVPGFRPGKAPRRILEARFGTEFAREQALKDGLPEYYADAVIAEDLDTIAAPEIDITAGEEDGDIEFDAVVELRPVVHIEGYEGLRVELDYTAPDDETLDRQIDQLRERFADLEDSTDPLVDGSYALVDVAGTVDGEPVDALTATDYLYEVGSGLIVPELDEALHGKVPGDVVEFTAELGERFGEQAGTEVAFRVLVKETKRKLLPELTDEWAAEVSEFDTVEALRADAARRLDVMAKLQAQVQLRDRTLDELAAIVPLAPPDALVNEDLERRLHDLMHRLEQQGMTIPQYLAVTGQDQQAFIDGLREGSQRSVLADLGLRAVVAAEAIEATDEELDREIERAAERAGQKPQKVRRDLERRGGVEAVRSDIARGKALEFLVDHANVVDREGNPIDLTLPEPEADEPAATDSPEAEHADTEHADTEHADTENPEVTTPEEEPTA